MDGISLPLLVFRHRLKRASDAAWHALCCQEYAHRWWATIPEAEHPSDISLYPGDRRQPFGAMKIPPGTFLAASEKLGMVHIENSVIAMAGAFEAYLSDLIGRCILLKPKLLATSEMTFEVSELVQPDVLSSPVTWIAQEYVQRSVRNKSHSKLIKRFSNMLKRDIEAANIVDYQAWNRYVLLRNALVHAAGLVTEDLSSAWLERFPSAGAAINLKLADLVAAHKAAYGLANTIDRFAVETVIKSSDAELLSRELFVVRGETDEATISREIANLLGAKFGKGHVEVALARQRREQLDTRKEFPIREEWLRQPHEI